MTRFDSSTLEIEFSAGTWTNVTGYYRTPLRIRFGRANQFQQTGAGVMKVRLDNFDGRFMPFNFGSPYYPNVVKSKRIRFKVTKGATTYTRHLGWIQAWEPKFPNESTRAAYVDVTSVDSLGLLALRKLRSNWSEHALYTARNASTHGDVWEAVGVANGYAALMTNLSPDSGAAAAAAAYVGDWPLLKFVQDDDVDCGQVVEVDSSSTGLSDKTSAGIQTGSLNIQWLMKCPTDPVNTASQPYCVATLYNSSSTALGNLMINNVSGQNQLAVYDAAGTTNLGTICGLPLGNWVGIRLRQHETNAAHLNAQCCTDLASTGGVYAVNDLNIDIRNIARIEFPGGTGAFPRISVGGVIAYGVTTLTDFTNAAPANEHWTVTNRMTDLANAVNQLGLSFTQVGDWSALCCLGRWQGRTALDVGNEICRTTRNGTTGSTGVMFGRPRDSQVLAISGGSTRPDTPVATVTAPGDLLSGLEMTAAVEQQPTRVTVESASLRLTRIDAAAENAGEYRSETITTMSLNGYSDASDIAGFYIARNTGLRFGKLRLDLTSSENDPTAALFDESGTNTGLFPTAKIRIADLPTDFFTYPTVDVFAEGWDEVYDDTGNLSIAVDTSPAQTRTLATETFTGTDGAGWAAQWVAGTGAATYTLSSNRGLVTPASSANAYGSRRLNLTSRADGELTGSIVLNNSASTGYAWLRGSSDLLTDGYNLRMNASGTLAVEKKVSGVRTDIATFSKTLTAGTQYGWRIRVVGKYINARVWQWGFSEGKTWDVAVTDTSVTAAGYAGIATINDATTTPRTVTFDDIIYTDGAGITGPNLP